jgi:carbonic anhydrase/acetyltransferase-like protein (isoleucine patch superfamily)
LERLVGARRFEVNKGDGNMNEKSIFHLAGWSAYLSAAATIIGAVTLVIFFSVGDPFGIMNDISSVIIGLTGIILLFSMYHLHRSVAPVMSLVAFVIGALAMLTAAVLQTLLVAIRMDFGEITTYAFGVFGASLVVYGYLVIANKTLPRGLGWWGIVAGTGYILVTTGFILGGPNSILTYLGG